jgi:hypothetical protein
MILKGLIKIYLIIDSQTGRHHNEMPTVREEVCGVGNIVHCRANQQRTALSAQEQYTTQVNQSIKICS